MRRRHLFFKGGQYFSYLQPNPVAFHLGHIAIVGTYPAFGTEDGSRVPRRMTFPVLQRLESGRAQAVSAILVSSTFNTYIRVWVTHTLVRHSMSHIYNVQYSSTVPSYSPRTFSSTARSRTDWQGQTPASHSGRSDQHAYSRWARQHMQQQQGMNAETKKRARENETVRQKNGKRRTQETRLGWCRDNRLPKATSQSAQVMPVICTVQHNRAHASQT